MTQVPLKQAVRDHVESKKLSDAQYDALAMKINAAPTPSAKPENRWRVGAAIAAAVILAGVIALVLQSDNAPIEVQIADEVARNHIKLKPMEVSSAR